jgi:hypothetical protein
MDRSENRRYFEKLAADELRLARTSPNRLARATHKKFAANYFDLARQIHREQGACHRANVD